jgi:hypothetical protein
MHRGFWSEVLKGRNHLEDLRIDGKILEWILRDTVLEGLDWVCLPQKMV